MKIETEILDEFPKKKGTYTSKYPWDEWLDGQIRVIRRGEHFDSKVLSMQSNFHKKAEERGFRVRTSLDGDTITFQALPGEADHA